MLLVDASAAYVGRQLHHFHDQLLPPLSCKPHAHLEAAVAAVLPGAVVARLQLLQLQGSPFDSDLDLYYVAQRKPYEHCAQAHKAAAANQDAVLTGAALR
jgi:hypothetical protein